MRGNLNGARKYPARPDNHDAPSAQQSGARDSAQQPRRRPPGPRTARRSGRSYLQSLAIRLKVAPGSPHVAESYTNLGGVASERRDFAVADDYLLRALRIKEAVAPRATTTAVTLHNLGNSAMLRGDSRAADAYLRRALAILADTAPNSVERLSI